MTWSASSIRLVISLLALCFVQLSLARSSFKAETCGYESCPTGKDGFINVHLLAHTHDDVGWLKTVDQYYYGLNNRVQQAGVQYIIDSVIQELKDHPDRRFIYVEVAFFLKWWEEQNEDTRNVVRNLVETGRFEFINGGWCMNDEAATHYVDIIDQMSLGLNILNDTFGECGRPRIAWQIDPFGHSREQALLNAQMGYDGLFFGRLDHEDKAQRMKAKSMEMVWSASNNLGASGELFTGILNNTYFAPPTFCFDIVCFDEPIVDNIESKDYNVERRVNEFLDFCQWQADSYATNHILVTMGSDFTYQDANVWFTNMDKLIKYANARQQNGGKFNLFYSTPSCYVKALNELNRSWPSKMDDFFPYGSDPHAYWTGYFTSRPASKYMIRQGSNLLQSCKQMESVLSMRGANNAGDVRMMKEGMGIMQHHDAATGTEKQHVADDYARLLDMGVVECQKTQTSYYEKELAIGAQTLPQVTYCKLNLSQCETTEENNRFVVNVYNSLSRNIDKYVRIPITNQEAAFQVLDPLGNPIPYQLVPIAEFVKALPGRTSAATRELVFLASNLPPLGSKSFYVEPLPSSRLSDKRNIMKSSQSKIKPVDATRVDNSISNEKIQVNVDGISGLMKSIVINGQESRLEQEFLWYAGMSGDNSIDTKRASGAYIFRPDGNSPSKIPTSGVQTIIIEGALVQEIHQVYNDWLAQVIRLYKGQDHIELDWVVGSIPIEDGVGKEIITRVSTNLGSNQEFYTDANGRQTLKRKINYRPDYTYTVTEPVAANYYPVNSHIYLKDFAGNQLSLLVDRAQGGASQMDGQLEIMVHRRLLYDDAFGVDEPLNEMAYGRGLVVRGTHYLIFSGKSDAARLTRSLGQELYKQPQISFIATSLSFSDWNSRYKTQQQFFRRTLPDNVNLLTLEARSDGKYLIRLEHVYDVNEDASLSQNAIISLNGLLDGFEVTTLEETMLGGNQWKQDSNRLMWNKANEIIQNQLSRDGSTDIPDATVDSIQLIPMQIRSFVMTVN